MKNKKQINSKKNNTRKENTRLDQWHSTNTLPISADPLFQQSQTGLQSKNDFWWSVSKASKIDDSQKQNGISQYDTHQHGPLQTAGFHQQLEQISAQTMSAWL